MSGWADGTLIDDGAAATGAPAPPSGAGGEPDAYWGIERAPDGSVIAVNRPFTPSQARDPQAIANFLQSFPELARPPSPSASNATALPPGAPASSAPTPPTAQPTPPQPSGSWKDGTVVGNGDWHSGTDVETPAMTRARSDAAVRLSNDPAWIRAIDNGFAFGAGGPVDAAGAWAETGVHNAISHALGMPDSGYSANDAYQAVRDANLAGDREFAQDQPLLNAGLGMLGMFGNPIARLGGRYIQGAKGLLPTVGRAALTNGLLGAAYGAGSAAPGEHIAGAGEGLGLGVLTAPVAPIAGAALSPVVKPIQTALSENASSIASRLPGVLGSGFQKTFGADQAAQTQAARDALARIGVDYDRLPQNDQAAIQTAIARGRSGAEAAVRQAGSGLPLPVPLSQGQLSGLPGQQLEENLALRGARGPDASIYARDFQTRQQAALRGNVQQIGANLGGGRPGAPGAAGAAVSDALNDRYEAARTGVSQAYDAARAAGPATLPTYDAQALTGSVRLAVSSYDPLNIPRVSREVDRLGALANTKTDPDIGDLFAARSRLTQLRASNDPVEAGAASAAVKAFDSGIDNSLSQSLFQGDPSAVQAWKTAIGARRDFGQLFEGNDLIQKLTQRQPIGGQMQLAVDPHDASNYIFGRSDLGFVGRQNLYRDLTRLRGVLGEDSAPWQAIKAEAFARAANAADGQVENGATMFSGSKFQHAWGDMNRADPDLMATLFSPEERDTIDRFAGVAARATNPVRGGDNPSNTATAAKALGSAMAAVRRLPFMVLKTVPFVDHFGDTLQNAVWASATKAATVGAQPSLVRPPVAVQFGAAALNPLTTKTSDDVRAAP